VDFLGLRLSEGFVAPTTPVRNRERDQVLSKISQIVRSTSDDPRSRQQSRFPISPSADDGKAADNSAIKRELDERLDEALEETFPGSDSIAVTPPMRPGKRRRGQHHS